MAYDAYGRSQQGGHGEPGYFDTNESRLPDYSSQYPVEPRDSTPARQRASSNAQQRTSPINGNMASAPERAELTGHEGVSPELIAAITEKVKREVVEHLKHAGTVDEQINAPTLQRQLSNKSNSTSSPPPTAQRVYTPPSPSQAQAQAQIPKSSNTIPPMESSRSPPASPLDKPSGVRFSDRQPTVRPPPARSAYSSIGLSTIDQKWGRLFDSEGKPTKRLGQFLRGLANYMINDFEPKNSIVVTPKKMEMYYLRHAFDEEVHPFVSIFRTQSNGQISKLYQALRCQHHLIQDHSSSTPTIPALTPLGFEQWMTIQILAYPDEESKRLEKVVLAMPIDADGEMVDGKPERLPKQISRHLLPDREDRQSRTLLDTAMADFFGDLGISSRRQSSSNSPSHSRHASISQSRSRPVEIHQVRTSPTSAKVHPLERERNPYTGAPSASESSSNEEHVKIERDRQPYTAQPGSGKVYTEGSNLSVPKLGRANSTSHTRDQPERAEMREGRRHRAKSNASQRFPPPSRSGGRRGSSPPLRSYSNSTPVDIDVGGSKYGPGPSSATSSFSTQSPTFSSSAHPSTSFPPPPPPIDIHNPRDRRPRDDRQYRRGTDEEARYTGDFDSPKDAERWDRYQEAKEAERADRPYDSRGSASIDPRDSNRDSRGAAYEDWYRDKSRGAGYDTYARY